MYFPTDYSGTIVFDENYLNCPDSAFSNAVLTLGKRASIWGEHSPTLADWIRGQDAVFSNCTDKAGQGFEFRWPRSVLLAVRQRVVLPDR
jgi:hypothetical protein